MNQQIQDVMDQLEVELRKARPNQSKIDELNKQLDKLLGTELKERDRSREAAWERSNRSSNR